MEKILKVIAGIAFAGFVVWWMYFYYSNCVFAGDTLANTPSWCIALR